MNGLTAQALIHTYTSPRSRGEVFLTRQDVADASKVADQVKIIQLDGPEFEMRHPIFWFLFDWTLGQLMARHVEKKTVALIKTTGGFNGGNPLKILSKYRRNFGDVKLKDIFQFKISFFNSHSPLMQHFCENVSTAHALDDVYNVNGDFNLNGHTIWPDAAYSDLYAKFWLNCPNGQSVRNRCKMVIDQLVEGGDILSIASGSAQALIIAAYQAKQQNKNIKILLTDVSHDALNLSKEKIQAAEVAIEQFSFLKASFQKLPQLLNGKKFNIVEACGILDYLPDRIAIKLIKFALSVLKPGGKIIISNMVETRAANLLSKTYNWRVVYRHPKQFESLIKKGGGKNIKIYLEPWSIHSMATANT
ncbi:MAG: methyltransferase domain-containing protein [Patescibacteria group bacterium]